MDIELLKEEKKEIEDLPLPPSEVLLAHNSKKVKELHTIHSCSLDQHITFKMADVVTF
jgi:hypothetical protein